MENTVRDNSTLKSEKVFSEYFFKSDFYEIKNWKYDFAHEKNPTKGYNDCLCVVFVRNGDFLFDLSNRSYDMRTGLVLIDKPNYEYTMRPATGVCTIFNFTVDLYHQLIEDLNLAASYFFSNPNILSLVLKASPEIEYLHHQAIMRGTNGVKLDIDTLVLEMLKAIVSAITSRHIDESIHTTLKRFQVPTVERAKEYMHENFAKDISLQEISAYSFVSPFHFSRIFKRLTGYSPYQYLLNIRLKHGEMLLKNSKLTIAEIASFSGFNSAELFTTTFKRKYKRAPTEYRKLIS